MRGIISGIKRMEIHDGDGFRTTVFFKGCPLKCIWCHNPESISFAPEVAYFKNKCIGCGMCEGKCDVRAAEICPTEAKLLYGVEYVADELVTELMRDKPFFDNGGGGVTMSGGECLWQSEFAIEVARRLFERGVSVYIDTCGYVKREVLEAILPYADRFLYDIKAIDPKLHRELTGRDNSLILDNLKYLSEQGADIEIRYPLVVGKNDGECESIGRLLSGMKGVRGVKVLRYHDFSASRYEALGMENTLPRQLTADDNVALAARTLSAFGVTVIGE